MKSIETDQSEYRLLFEQAVDGIFIADAQGRYVEVNPAGCKMLGYTREEVLNRTLADIVAEEEIPRLPAEVARFGGGEIVTSEWRLRRKNGSQITAEISGRLLTDGRLQGIVRDVTDRGRIENELRDSEERFRSLTSVLTDLYWSANATGEFVTPQTAWSKYTGQSWDEQRGFGWASALHPGDRARIREAWERARQEHSVYEAAERVWHAPTQQYRHCIARATPLLNPDGAVREWVGSCTDVHAQKTAVEALAGDKNVLEQITTGVPLPEALETLIREIEAQSIDGILGSVLLLDGTGQKLLSGAAPSLPEAYNRAIDGIAIGPNVGSCGTAAFFRKATFVTDIATDPLWADFKELALTHGLAACCSTPIFSSRDELLGTIAIYYPQAREPSPDDLQLIDRATRLASIIIERKRAEDALRASELRFRAMADNIPQLAWIADADSEGQIHWFNRGWFDYTGTTLVEMQGSGWKSVHHPDYVDRVAQKFEHHVKQGLDWEDTFPLRGKDGEYRWFLSRMKVVRGEAGETLQIFGTNTDITELQRAEQELLESESKLRALTESLEARVAERTADLLSANEQLQGFTYTVAHDLRQHIRGISINASVIVSDAAHVLDEAHREHLLRLTFAAKQLSRLVDDLLQYARLGRQELRREAVDMSRLAADVVSQLRQEKRCADDAVIEIQPNLKASGDPVMLSIALQNLLENACKYSDRDRATHIRFGQDKLGFLVQDDGIGFEMRFAAKIFEPFERLHRGSDYVGTGIGLANVKRIVEKHGGSVWAESEPGKGATFRFTLGCKGVASP